MPCVTTFTMPVHLHGAYFVSFLLLTGRCYDAETSVILLLLDRAFTDMLFANFGEVNQVTIFTQQGMVKVATCVDYNNDMYSTGHKQFN